ncbi:MAG: hypothetical protein ACR2K3_10020 [Nocardioides sp.]
MADSAHSTSFHPVELVVRVLVVVGLAVDAYIHLHLASRYQLAQPSGIGQGNLFRIEAVVAIVVGLYLLVRGSRPAYLLAVLTGLGGAALVVLYRYVDVAAIGPIPSMYEPLWFGEKTLSLVAEAAAGVLALIGLALPRRRHTHS